MCVHRNKSWHFTHSFSITNKRHVNQFNKEHSFSITKKRHVNQFNKEQRKTLMLQERADFFCLFILFPEPRTVLNRLKYILNDSFF